MALPHIQNSEAGRNYYEPYFTSLFEVYFTIPAALQASFGKDVNLLSEHVTKVGGLELDKTPEVKQQNYHGTIRSYLAPHISDTSFTITVDLTLNLRNETDNYIYKLFKAWNNLNYNIETGESEVKANYIAEFLRVAVSNRKGDILRDVTFKDVILTKVTSPTDFDYTSDEPGTLSLEFKSDWKTEENA